MNHYIITKNHLQECFLYTVSVTRNYDHYDLIMARNLLQMYCLDDMYGKIMYRFMIYDNLYNPSILLYFMKFYIFYILEKKKKKLFNNININISLFIIYSHI